MLSDLGGIGRCGERGRRTPTARPVFVCESEARSSVAPLSRPSWPAISSLSAAIKAVGTVGCVDANAIAMLVGSPAFQLSRTASLHMSDKVRCRWFPARYNRRPSRKSARRKTSLFQDRQRCAANIVARLMGFAQKAAATALASSVAW